MSVTAAEGWLAAGIVAGTKPSGALDLALFWSEHEAVVAGAFTTSTMPSAHVQVCKPRVALGHARGCVISSGIANAFTGPKGIEDTEDVIAAAADALDGLPEEMLMCATGTIGPRLPVDKVIHGVREAAKQLASDGGDIAAEAIMTTDTGPKTAQRSIEIGGKLVTVGGMAKGAGMIAPRMELQGTLLVFLTTDAAIDAASLRHVLGGTVPRTFDAITVDGCMSTSDTVLLFANGASGVDSSGSEAFAHAVYEVMAELAYAVVADGEGATRVIRVRVTHAAHEHDAREAAREVATSQLLRAAVWGNDPNMGRIVQAIGMANIPGIDQTKLDVSMCGVPLSHGGVETGKRASAEQRMREGGEVLVEVSLNMGHDDFEFLTCDLTPEYVKFNGDYTT